MNRRYHSNGIGIVSLIMIFAVLYLTIFAILTLVTANNDYELAQNFAQSVDDYYQADRNATNILTSVLHTAKKGQKISGSINGVTVEATASNIISYDCPIGDRQILSVMVALNDQSYRIIKWQTAYIGDWAIDDKIVVWDGE